MKGEMTVNVPWKRPFMFYYHDKTGKIGTGGNKKKGKKKK
jgi:hypothetical protein